jgi:hypothetical protein
VAVLRGGDGFDHDLRRAVTQRVFRHVPVAMDTTFAKKATAEVSRSRRVRREGTCLQGVAAFDPPQPT